MPTYQIEVAEVVATWRRYTIEAEDREEALEKAATGDTVGEEDIKMGAVIGRHPEGDTLELVEGEEPIALAAVNGEEDDGA
jgi:hypothetical protein